MPNEQRYDPGALLKATDIIGEDRLNCSASFWYGEIRRGVAPKPLKLGKASRWTEQQYRDYVAAKERAAGAVS